MKTILSKIYIHPITYIVFFITFFTGQFKDYILFIFIILCHESGHIIISLLFKWNINRVILLPIGCITKYDIILNKPLIEELIVSISGIIFQLFFMLLFKNMFNSKYIFYNISLILFNLIPIYPLDGSKMFNVFLNKILPFKVSHLITMYLSMIIIIILSLKSSFIFLISFVLLLIKVFEELNNHKFIYNRFLLERYINNYNFKKTRIVKNINNFYKDCKHIIKDKNYEFEIDKLKKIFK